MSMLWIEGFDEVPDDEVGPYLTSSGYLTALGVGQTTGRGGRGRALSMSNDASNLVKYLGNQIGIITGFGLKFSGGASLEVIAALGAETGNQLQLCRTASNRLMLRYNNEILGQTSGEVVRSDVWDYIEWKIILVDETSLCTIRVNQRQVVTFTFDGSDVEIDRMFLYGEGNTNLFDDWYILNEDGTFNDDFLGDVTVENVALSSNGDTIQFTPYGSTVNYRNVNRTGFSDDERFNAGSSIGLTDLFQVRDLDVAKDTVYAVMVGVRAKKLGTGFNEAAVLVKYDSVEYLSDDFSADADFRTVFFPFDEKPGGGQWDVDAFNDLQVGYRITG